MTWTNILLLHFYPFSKECEQLAAWARDRMVKYTFEELAQRPFERPVKIAAAAVPRSKPGRLG
jgi:hypothetical protein